MSMKLIACMPLVSHAKFKERPGEQLTSSDLGGFEVPS